MFRRRGTLRRRPRISPDLDSHDPQHTARLLHSLADGEAGAAEALSGQGKAAAAMAMQKEALEVFRRAHGEDHEKVALCLLNIGTSLKKAKDYAAARESIEKSIATYRRLPGNYLRFIASALPHLGVQECRLEGGGGTHARRGARLPEA